jgi:hypothetical protein
VLEGLKPERLIAYGESQSAIRMVSYVDGVHPLAKVYDGFFIHSRGAGGVPFDSAGGSAGLSLGGFGGGSAVFIRDDIDEKVFQFETETDVTGTKVEDSASKIREGGFILEPEAQGFVSDAQAAHVPN